MLYVREVVIGIMLPDKLPSAYILKDFTAYDLLGRSVSTPQKAVVYIQNGKKYVLNH